MTNCMFGVMESCFGMHATTGSTIMWTVCLCVQQQRIDRFDSDSFCRKLMAELGLLPDLGFQLLVVNIGMRYLPVFWLQQVAYQNTLRQRTHLPYELHIWQITLLLYGCCSDGCARQYVRVFWYAAGCVAHMPGICFPWVCASQHGPRTSLVSLHMLIYTGRFFSIVAEDVTAYHCLLVTTM